MNKKVVVTGMGVISPLGNNLVDFEKALFAGKSGVGPITRFDPTGLPTTIASEVKNIASDFRDVKITFALLAAQQAIFAAFGHEMLPAKTSSFLSLGIGLELFSMEDLVALKSKGRENISEVEDLTFLNTPSNICGHLISKKYQLTHAPAFHISACAAGTDAIGHGFLKIARGEVLMALAGGTDSMINPMGVGGFCRIGAMTTKNSTPHLASRPFDKSRDGFVLGEGAGFLVLEEEEFARKRGAKIVGRILGYGNSLDAYSVSDPHPQGEGAIKSMHRALQSAHLCPADISAISVHGTGTAKNDPAEAAAIRTLFKEDYKRIPAFATKSMTGHLISAAGAVESIATFLSLQRQQLHPTINLQEVADGCELNHVIGKSKNCSLKYILKNSFGFGGQNASLVLALDEGPRFC